MWSDAIGGFDARNMSYVFDVHDVKRSVGSILPTTQTGKEHFKSFFKFCYSYCVLSTGGEHSVPAGYQISIHHIIFKVATMSLFFFFFLNSK